MTPLNSLDLLRLVISLGLKLPGLYRRPYWSRQRLEAYQLGLIRERLSEARRYVSYYANGKFPAPDEIKTLADWKIIPILSKADLLSNLPNGNLDSRYAKRELIESKSSGSTGQALDVYYDRESFYLFVLAGLRLYQMAFPYRPWHRQTYIYTTPYPFDSLFGLFPMEFISTLTPIPETIEKLRRKPPELLVCYPSHLRSIVDQMSSADFQRIRPLAVNVNSEMSTAEERRRLGQKLNTFVFDDYSSEELTRIASQCREGRYHLFEDINYIEIVDDQGEPVPNGTVGNIIGTNLHNRAMPLLRYKQGDRGSISSKPCPCGRTFRVLEKLEGRKNDSFILPDGKSVSSGFLLDLTYGVFLNYDQAVREFCLIQDQPAVWTLEVVPGSSWNSNLQEQIRADLESCLNQPAVHIVCQIVDRVTRTASGKANPIISRVRRN